MANETLVEEHPKKKKRPKIPVDEEIPLTDTTLRKKKEKSQANIEQVLQQAYLDSSQEIKTGKKKKVKKDKNTLDGRNIADIIELESLKKGEGLVKDEDQTLLANTYDPDNDPKSTKSNKRRQREQMAIQNRGFEENEDVIRTKKKVKKKITENIDKDMSISELASSPVNKAEDIPPPTEKKKKKKRTPKSPMSDTDGEQVLSGQETQDDIHETVEGITSDDPDQTMVKKKKKKKPKPKTEEEAQAAAYADALTGEAAAAAEAEPPRVIADEGKIVGVTIHRTDKLKTDFFISHPLVRVSMIDLSTGKYLKKQSVGRPVSSYYERDRDNVDMVLPILTRPFDFKAHKSTLPIWEEMLIFNENYHYFIQGDPNVITFFEVLDMVSMNTAATRYNIVKQEGGWHRIAWGFLKLVNAHGSPNTDKKVRLQLYMPPMRFRPRGEEVEIYQWYKSAPRVPYPSTLYVTIKGIVPPDVVEPSARSMFATQEERGQMSFDQLARTLDGGEGTSRREGARRGPSMWSRLAGQVCKVPNAVFLNLPAGRKGCFTVRFSNDGKSIACGCHDSDGHPIKIYEIPSGKLKGSFLGHYSLVYDMCWSKDDKHLLSASADGTARVWDIETMAVTQVKTLPHPSFVYAARYHVRVNKVAVTGGYDRIIRVWSLKGDDLHGKLLQELDSHISYINSICFDEEGGKMFSADSLGQIKIWNVFVTEKASSKGVIKDWSLFKDISDPEIKGIAINKIELHPNGRRLMVHCRDNIIRMFDLRVHAIMQRYIGALNFREHIRSTITPCGSFVFAGSEDNCAYVWNSETGDQVAMYSELSFKHPVCDVAFHPFDHMVAFCSFGEVHPVFVYRFDQRVATRDAGFETENDDVLFKKTGRPMSPQMMTSPKQDDVVETSRSRVTMTRDDFEATEQSRLDRVMRKLETVSAFQGSMSMAATNPEHPLAIPRALSPTLGVTTMGSGNWGSTFDSTGMYGQPTRTTAFATPLTVSVDKSPVPAAFSPHATQTMASTAQFQQHASQLEYQRQSGSGWRPGFSAVGKQGMGASLGRSPQIALNMSQGKPQFTFQGPTAKKSPKADLPPDIHSSEAGQSSSEVAKEPPPVAPRDTGLPLTREKFVALYDYQAQRSDELSLLRGDMISILFKDNDNWWMGELEDGRQGFFPANYVAGYSHDKTDANREWTDEAELEYKVQVEEEDNVRASTTTAIVTKSGELKFLSEAEESDVDRTHKKKKKARKPKDTTINIETDEDTPRKTTKKRKPKPQMYPDDESIA